MTKNKLEICKILPLIVVWEIGLTLLGIDDWEWVGYTLVSIGAILEELLFSSISIF